PLPASLVGSSLLPGPVSARLAFLLVRSMPRNRRQFFYGIAVVVALLLGVWGYKIVLGIKKSFATSGRELNDLIGQFDLLRSGIAPSHWMTRGVMAAARDDLAGALVPLAQVWSNGLVVFVLAAGIARRGYRPALGRYTGGGRGKKVYGTSWLDRVMETLVFYLDKPTRVLVVKDFRTFRRDPTQWVLLIIFGLLMLLGASNFRQYYSFEMRVMDKYA